MLPSRPKFLISAVDLDLNTDIGNDSELRIRSFYLTINRFHDTDDDIDVEKRGGNENFEVDDIDVFDDVSYS